MISCSKNRTLGLFLVILFLAPIAGASSSVGNIIPAEDFTTSVNSSTENDLFSELSAQMKLYNEDFDNVPLLVKRLVGSEEIAGKIELNNGEMNFTVMILPMTRIQN
jgi:hypothetical protein